MTTEAVTLFKEDVLALGQTVVRTLDEMTRLLKKESTASLELIEEQEESINQLYLDIEEKCMDLLLEKEMLDAKAIRMLLASTTIAGKFERMADHANRVARIACWAQEDKIEIPAELTQMASIVHRMVQDTLLSFLTDATERIQDILQRDSEVDYLDDILSKKLLSNLGKQDQAGAMMRAQFLFCSRFIERMGDLCTSVAKRTYFIVTGHRMNTEASGVK